MLLNSLQAQKSSLLACKIMQALRQCMPRLTRLEQCMLVPCQTCHIACRVPMPGSFARPGSYILRAVCKTRGSSRTAGSIMHARTVIVPPGRPTMLCFPHDYMACHLPSLLTGHTYQMCCCMTSAEHGTSLTIAVMHWRVMFMQPRNHTLPILNV